MTFDQAPPRVIDDCPSCSAEVSAVTLIMIHGAVGTNVAHPCGHAVVVTITAARVALAVAR